MLVHHLPSRGQIPACTKVSGIRREEAGPKTPIPYLEP